MAPMSKEARRLSIKISSLLQKQLRESAMPLAVEQGEEEILPVHIEFALRQLASDNAALLHCLLGEGENHAQRRAG